MPGDQHVGVVEADSEIMAGEGRVQDANWDPYDRHGGGCRRSGRGVQSGVQSVRRVSAGGEGGRGVRGTRVESFHIHGSQYPRTLDAGQPRAPVSQIPGSPKLKSMPTSGVGRVGGLCWLPSLAHSTDAMPYMCYSIGIPPTCVMSRTSDICEVRYRWPTKPR